MVQIASEDLQGKIESIPEQRVIQVDHKDIKMSFLTPNPENIGLGDEVCEVHHTVPRVTLFRPA